MIQLIHSIALMNVKLKLIKLVVNRRLAEIAEIGDLHPSCSFGFRKHCLAPSCSNYVINKVKGALLAKKDTIVIFQDPSQAFDCVILLNTLQTLQTLSGNDDFVLFWQVQTILPKQFFLEVYGRSRR